MLIFEEGNISDSTPKSYLSVSPTVLSAWQLRFELGIRQLASLDSNARQVLTHAFFLYAGCLFQWAPSFPLA